MVPSTPLGGLISLCVIGFVGVSLYFLPAKFPKMNEHGSTLFCFGLLLALSLIHPYLEVLAICAAIYFVIKGKMHERIASGSFLFVAVACYMLSHAIILFRL